MQTLYDYILLHIMQGKKKQTKNTTTKQTNFSVHDNPNNIILLCLAFGCYYSLKLLLWSITAIYTTYYVITIFNHSCSASNHYHDKTRQIHHQYSRLAIQLYI